MSGEKVEDTPLEPAGYVQCPVTECGAIVESVGRYTHFRNVHPDLDYQKYRDKFVQVAPPEPLNPQRGPPSPRSP
jgi:hypothetical protein